MPPRAKSSENCSTGLSTLARPRSSRAYDDGLKRATGGQVSWLRQHEAARWGAALSTGEHPRKCFWRYVSLRGSERN